MFKFQHLISVTNPSDHQIHSWSHVNQHILNKPTGSSKFLFSQQLQLHPRKINTLALYGSVFFISYSTLQFIDNNQSHPHPLLKM